MSNSPLKSHEVFRITERRHYLKQTKSPVISYRGFASLDTVTSEALEVLYLGV